MDTYQGYYELSEFQYVQQLEGFISLISYFLQKCAKTQAFIDEYYKT